MSCTDNSLAIHTGELRLASWMVPRNVKDVVATSNSDGLLMKATELPGKLMMDLDLMWYCDAPVDQMVLIRVTRGGRSWITSNPNAVQFRDRWVHAINATPDLPLVTSILNSQVGSAIDLGTNSVAEPNPGLMWTWMGAHSSDEWVGPLTLNDYIRIRYRCYVWTPPPWSDNANLNSPRHEAYAGWTRIQLISFPTMAALALENLVPA